LEASWRRAGKAEAMEAKARVEAAVVKCILVSIGRREGLRAELLED